MFLSSLYGTPDGEPDDSWLERSYLASFRKCFNDLHHLLAPDVLRESGGEEALAAIVKTVLSFPKA
jgi:hypothetical protein